MSEENNIININGEEYDPSDLTNQQKYLIAQVQDLQSKRQPIQFQLDQISVALDSFTNALINSLQETEETETPKEKLNG